MSCLSCLVMIRVSLRSGVYSFLSAETTAPSFTNNSFPRNEDATLARNNLYGGRGGTAVIGQPNFAEASNHNNNTNNANKTTLATATKRDDNNNNSNKIVSNEKKIYPADNAMMGVPPSAPSQRTTIRTILSNKIRNLPRPEPEFLVRTSYVKDDLSVGKSCKKKDSSWECRECGAHNHGSVPAVQSSMISNDSSTNADDDSVFDWSKCHLLTPRNSPDNIRNEPATTMETADQPADQVSMHDPLDPSQHRHALRHTTITGDGSNQRQQLTYAQVPCEKLEDCWDISKCKATTTTTSGPLTVFGYGEHAISLIQQAAKLHPRHLQWVPEPQNACLLLVAPESFLNGTASSASITQDITNSQTWDGGRNHLIWGSAASLATTNMDHAALATITASIGGNHATTTTLRLGYDIPLATLRAPNSSGCFQDEDWIKKPPPAHSSSDHQRPTLLVTFLDSSSTTRERLPWWHHGYVADNYWEQESNSDAVIVHHTDCFSSSNKNSKAMSIMMMNATFCFTDNDSYQFAHALTWGAIPIVSTAFVPPMAPEIDWSDCLVQVSEARVIDIPRIVRQFSGKQVLERRKRCRYLSDATIGRAAAPGGGGRGLDDAEMKSLAMALLIWNQRIKNYHKFKHRGEAVLRDEQ